MATQGGDSATTARPVAGIVQQPVDIEMPWGSALRAGRLGL
jgi:hypothetical protein